jgi:DNA-binding HxlR family transcriptional regulator
VASSPNGLVQEGPDGALDHHGGDEVENRLGAGLRVLTTLATPLNFLVLRALGERPMRLAELRQATGLPAQTTLRGHLASLIEIGALSKRPTSQMPYAVENELTPMGEEMLAVADRLEAWLNQAPGAPSSLTNGSARGIVKAFVDGWGSTMLRGLGGGPMSLTELDRRIAQLSYPALERRLSSMRMAGLVEACDGPGASTPYTVTEWARLGVGPLVASGRCERRHMRERAAPITRDDIEAAFMLTLPLVGLPAETSGSCQLEVDADPADAREQVGVRVKVESGAVVSCDSDGGPTSDDFASGSAEKWFDAVSGEDENELRFGAGKVAAGVVSGLRSALASPQAPPEAV